MSNNFDYISRNLNLSDKDIIQIKKLIADFDDNTQIMIAIDLWFGYLKNKENKYD